ncbi:MAG: hypothetical protein KF691_15865 [Phycisphaeraceae bacterium]|nr:hypothetical protein [Phycisphaeraceae bacterium]
MALRFRGVCILVLAVGAGAALMGGNSAEPGAPESGQSAATQSPWYENEIRAFEEADRASPPARGQVLFTGSSSIRMWISLAEDMKPMPVLNRGFGGSQTRDVIEVFDRIVLPYKPSAIVYYCGDNDLGTDNHDFAGAAKGFIDFDKKARAVFPDVRVFYIAIKPSLARWNNWPAMERANSIVNDYCNKTPGATFLDIATPMLGPEGKLDPTLFREDGLHMTAKGYAIWTDVVRPAVMSAWEEIEAKKSPKPVK